MKKKGAKATQGDNGPNDKGGGTVHKPAPVPKGK